MDDVANRSKIERDIIDGKARIGPDGEPYAVTTWSRVDLTAALVGEPRPGTRYLPRTDGQTLIYPGRPHVFFGASESLKSWAALLACKSYLDASESALYIDFESDEFTFVERARIVGIKDPAIGRWLRYIRPVEPLKGNANALADLIMEETDLKPSLVVLDGVTECYALHGWDVNKGTDAVEFQKLFGAFSDDTATIAIDHTAKDAGRGVLGSQHKRAGLNGAEYEFTALRREGRHGHSTAQIKVTKDRHGHVREFAPSGNIGTLHVDDAIDKAEVYIKEPNYADMLLPDERMKAELLAAITETPGQNTRALRAAVNGDDHLKTDALVALVATDAAHIIKKGTANLYYPGPGTRESIVVGGPTT